MKRMLDKKVLMISPFFYPEEISTGKYNTHMAEAFLDAGYVVDVLCSHPMYPYWKPVFSDSLIDGVNIFRGGEKIRYTNSIIIRRMVLELWFAIYVFKYIRRTKNTYEHTVLIFPPNLAGIIVKHFTHSNKYSLIGIVHDVQGILVGNDKSMLRWIVGRAVNVLESLAFNSVDKLIFLSEQMKSNAQRIYPDLRAKSLVIYPFITIDSSQETNKKYFNEKKINIVYSGALGEKQNPRKLLQLFELIAEDERFACHIFSAGRVYDDMKSQSDGSRILYETLVPQNRLVDMLSSSSLQVVPQLFDTSAGAFPSKIPNIVALDVPLLCITPEHGELHSLLHDSTRALLCDHWEVKQIASDVIKFMNEMDDSKVYQPELAHKFSAKKFIQTITA